MTQKKTPSAPFDLLMIATPDPRGTIRFPPLREPAHNTENRATPAENTAQEVHPSPQNLEPYYGHPLHIPWTAAQIRDKTIKPTVQRYLDAVFGQDIGYLWLFDETFEESVSLSSEEVALLAAGARDRLRLKEPESLVSESPEPPRGQQAITLHLIRITQPLATPQWPSFPQILRSLPKTRARIPYLRMFQILMGQAAEKTEAVDVEQLKKILTKEDFH